MKLCVIGLGYIGLPTALMFAESGCEVIGVDKNIKVVEALNRGEILIMENGLKELAAKVFKTKRLRASTVPSAADVFILSLPTPLTAEKKADLSYVESAARELSPLIKKGNLVILESTSPVGTTDGLLRSVLEDGSGLKAGGDFYLGYCPERVIPGHILKELVYNNRIAGGYDKASAKKISELYRLFVKGEITETDSRTAELCKLSENTYRDVNIAFANELAKICGGFGVSVWELIKLCNKHPRVNILSPGPGVGGHCIAVDPWFMVEKMPKNAGIIIKSRLTNDSMPYYVAEQVTEILKGVISPKIAVLGVAYKPDVDDMRESPVLTLIGILRNKGFEVVPQDPFVFGKRQDIIEGPIEAARGADLVILGVNHSVYKDLRLPELASVMRNKNLFDTRNAVDREKAEEAGFHYYLLGDSRREKFV